MRKFLWACAVRKRYYDLGAIDSKFRARLIVKMLLHGVSKS